MWISLIFDGVITLLLGVTIVYCYLVNRRLAALRSGKDELKQVIEDLTVATTRAQMSIERLKEAGKEVVFALEDDVRKGRALSDELSLMIESGNNLADRLEGGRERSATANTPSVELANDEGREGTVSGNVSQSRVRETTQVRARVQVQTETGHPKAQAAPKPIMADQAIENELLKALRRAR